MRFFILCFSTLLLASCASNKNTMSSKGQENNVPIKDKGTNHTSFKPKQKRVNNSSAYQLNQQEKDQQKGYHYTTTRGVLDKNEKNRAKRDKKARKEQEKLNEDLKDLNTSSNKTKKAKKPSGQFQFFVH
ncbi:MAG: hypothetical protein ACK40G_01025 [Cytophagaceae bacterium]